MEAATSSETSVSYHIVKRRHFPKNCDFPVISSWKKFWSVTVVPKYLNFATFSKDLLTIFKLRFRPAFWWQDTTICLLFSALTSRATPLLGSNRAYVFFFMVFMFTTNKLAWAQNRNWCVSSNSIPSRFLGLSSRCFLILLSHLRLSLRLYELPR